MNVRFAFARGLGRARAVANVGPTFPLPFARSCVRTSRIMRLPLLRRVAAALAGRRRNDDSGLGLFGDGGDVFGFSCGPGATGHFSPLCWSLLLWVMLRIRFRIGQRWVVVERRWWW